SVLWLSEPDAAQHRTAPGSKASLAAIKQSDQMLGIVLGALEKKGARAQTDVFVVSDHAFSTISHGVDVAEVLNRAGFRAFHQFLTNGPPPGAVLVVRHGGSVFFYLPEHDRQLIEKLAHFLQVQPFTGVVISRTPMEGAFTLQDLRMDSPDAPELAIAMRWSAGRNHYNVAGLMYSDDEEEKVRQGNHASLSPYDLHNTCVASGPDFRKGVQSYLPSGNVDLAPTIAWILDAKPSPSFSGRVLKEALAGETPTKVEFATHRLEAAWDGENCRWDQYLNFSEVNGVRYFDE